MGKKVVYRTAPHNGGLVFATEERAELVSKIHEAISESETWAEFRKAMPKTEYSDILRQSFDDVGEPRPKGEEPFTAEQLAGWSEGDYPPWLQQEMEGILPIEILRKYGKLESTFINGDYWMLYPDAVEKIIVDLEEAGFEVAEAENLSFH